jgi:hypothetical protein
MIIGAGMNLITRENLVVSKKSDLLSLGGEPIFYAWL